MKTSLKGSEELVDTSILLRRMAIVRHCLNRLEKHSHMSTSEFMSDIDAQDIVLRNLQVGIQASLDIALHIVSDEGWELPGASTGTFDILSRHGVLPQELADRLRLAVQMRSLLVHAYDAIDMQRVHRTCQDCVSDLELFAECVVDHFKL
jgi:uncharacterized protein YutE (UPF0331/DUF86 family)